jgi:hypothetical protein
MTKCALLKEHTKALDDILAWLKAEIAWWEQFQEDGVRNFRRMAVEQVDVSSLTDILRFEEDLDKLARSALARKGPQ